jgi:hypothetical protein
MFYRIESNDSVHVQFTLADSGLKIFGGVKNITNDCQLDFASGKNRGSNYVHALECPVRFILE